MERRDTEAAELLKVGQLWRTYHPQSHWAVPQSEAVSQWGESSEITFKLLGLKSKFIFILTDPPVCKLRIHEGWTCLKCLFWWQYSSM